MLKISSLFEPTSTELVEARRNQPGVHPYWRETETPAGYIRAHFYGDMSSILRDAAPDLWADVKLDEKGGLHLDVVKELWNLDSCAAVTDTCDEFAPGAEDYLSSLAVHNLSVHTCPSCRTAPLYEPDWECRNHKACILFVGKNKEGLLTRYARSLRQSYLIMKELGRTTCTIALGYTPMSWVIDIIQDSEHDAFFRNNMERRPRGKAIPWRFTVGEVFQVAFVLAMVILLLGAAATTFSTVFPRLWAEELYAADQPRQVFVREGLKLHTPGH